MKYTKKQNSSLDKQSFNTYDDGNIPQIDLPLDSFPEEMPARNVPDDLKEYQVPFKEFPPIHPPTVDQTKDVIPDEIPRRDGPGGDSQINC